MPISQTPSLQELKTFFAGPNDLAAYVRGGAYVPNIAANSAISTAVAGLNLAQFKGADKASSVSIGTTQTDYSSYASGSNSYSGDMGVRIPMAPSGGNGTYTYSISVVSFTQTVSGWTTPQMSGTSQDSVYIFTAFNGALAVGRIAEASAVVDVTVSSGGQTATKRFNIYFNYTRNGGGGGIVA